MASGHIAIFDASIGGDRLWCVSLMLRDGFTTEYAKSGLWTNELCEAEEGLVKATASITDFLRYGLGYSQPLGGRGWELVG